jgi:C4-dicarboxylate-specific signal transduction histidine kinase
MLASGLIGADIELESPPLPQSEGIKADQHQVEQVLMNLPINASGAMPTGG